MKINITQEFYPIRLIVSAEPRYWEDAEVNGIPEPEEGKTRIPCRDGNLWNITIDLHSGQIHNWPEGTHAKVHYKVCDQGEYWLEDADGKRVKYKSCYVPDDLLAVGEERGYGDYIILDIGTDGKIIGWKSPVLDGKEWEVA